MMMMVAVVAALYAFGQGIIVRRQRKVIAKQSVKIAEQRALNRELQQRITTLRLANAKASGVESEVTAGRVAILRNPPAAPLRNASRDGLRNRRKSKGGR